MPENKPHHHVAFASRYTATHFHTFDASSALWRAEALVDDAKCLVELQEKCEEAKIVFGRFLQTFEVISYYAVGFVTCLEWHARSRLVDLLVYRPDCIETSDVKNIDKTALSQMMSERVTVPYLLGAAIKISSVEDYIKVFTRLFTSLSIKADPDAILRKFEFTHVIYDEKVQETLHAVLTELFEFRHHLVHEIDLSVVGHFSLRDVWAVERAIWFGNAVVACIKAMEVEVTKHVPKDFPNRLDEHGAPEDEYEKVAAKIAALEKKLSDHFIGNQYENAEGWQTALKASRAGVDSELKFLEEAEFLRPVRHLDFRQAVQLEYLKLRLGYLKILEREVDDVEK